MPTRLERLREFSQAEPPAGQVVQLLCEDHNGTYLIPSLCRWIDGKWLTERGTAITAKVVGWRPGPVGYHFRQW